MNKNSDEIVLSFHEALLRESDVALLQGPYWLNDHIISFYLEYLDNVAFKNNQQMLFISPEVTQCLKIVSKDEINIFLEPLNATKKSFIFFPLNDNQQDRAGGSHWSLLVFSRPERAFYHFDSLASINEYQCQNFVSKIKDFLDISNVTFRTAHCLNQSNGYDCGIHVLCNIENIAHHVVNSNKVDGVSQLTHHMVAQKRNQILDIIMKLQES